MTDAQGSLSSALTATSFARPQVVWSDSQGTRYTFECFSPQTPWVRLPAVYVLARTAAHSEWVPLLVGETENLREQMADPATLAAARRQGMDAVHVQFFTGPAKQRAALARALIKALAPPLNEAAEDDANVDRQRSSILSRAD